MINNLQIAMHSPMINVQFPGNAFMIYDVMIVVATFDILPTDDIFPYIFPNLPERDALSPKFERLEYGSMYSIMNMGTLLLIFFCYLIMFALCSVHLYFRQKKRMVTR